MTTADKTPPDRETTRALLAELLEQTKLYHTSQEYLDLLNFLARMGNFSPFNALLLHIQKPGLTWAASRWDWQTRFERRVKSGARPLLIMWPFGPVALVYDLADTEGKDLPVAVSQVFRATGPVTKARVTGWVDRLARKQISVEMMDWGDGQAGEVQCLREAKKPKEVSEYLLRINLNHDPNVQFATLAHELGHVFLGHLGADTYHGIPGIESITRQQAELEAESLSYLVCRRWGVQSRADAYLADYAQPGKPMAPLNLDRITRATGQVEAILAIGAKTLFQPRSKGDSRQMDLFGPAG